MYIKYKQVQIAIDRNDVALDRRLNTFNIWCGFVASFGLTFVANFQETKVPVMHFVGALMTFGVGSVYFMTHSRITFEFKETRTRNPYTKISNMLCYSRIVMCALFLPLFFTNMGCSIFSMLKFDGDTILWWTNEHKAYDVHLVATISEWIMAIMMVSYLLTYVTELKWIKFQGILFKNSTEDQITMNRDYT